MDEDETPWISTFPTGTAILTVSVSLGIQRELPSRAGVYFVVALGLFPHLGHVRVWGKLTAGLAALDLRPPSEKALRDLRRRLGPEPLRALFVVVAGPLAQPGTPGVRFRGLRTVAFDGCNSLKIPDTDRNRSWAGKIRYRMGLAGYPTLRVMALAETGTRGLLGATVGRVRWPVYKILCDVKEYTDDHDR